MQWVFIPNFPCYQVSEYGAVRRALEGLRGNRPGRLMKPYWREDGYRMYILRHDNRSFHRKAHQLVAEAFLGPRPFPGAEVRHLDGSKTNDHHSNLCWGTSRENKDDMVRHGTRPVGETHGGSKVTDVQVKEIRTLAAGGVLQRVIGKRFGIGQAQVSRIISGARRATQ